MLHDKILGAGHFFVVSQKSKPPATCTCNHSGEKTNTEHDPPRDSGKNLRKQMLHQGANIQAQTLQQPHPHAAINLQYTHMHTYICIHTLQNTNTEHASKQCHTAVHAALDQCEQYAADANV